MFRGFNFLGSAGRAWVWVLSFELMHFVITWDRVIHLFCVFEEFWDAGCFFKAIEDWH